MSRVLYFDIPANVFDLWNGLNSHIARSVLHVSCLVRDQTGFRLSIKVFTGRASHQHPPFHPINWLCCGGWRESAFCIRRMDCHVSKASASDSSPTVHGGVRSPVVSRLHFSSSAQLKHKNRGRLCRPRAIGRAQDSIWAIAWVQRMAKNTGRKFSKLPHFLRRCGQVRLKNLFALLFESKKRAESVKPFSSHIQTNADGSE